ncbi:zinc transporter 11-like [Cryptomeria japonica]|uniref:zinc transporter 11-like n=1 Tax=Cryptomeria japonica TaxID=3369 RepID=UPI0025ABD1A5|nr:zinc transporter 11-like [Cryptomeria japonica]
MAATRAITCLVIFLVGSLNPPLEAHGGGTGSANDHTNPNLRSKSLIVVKICCLIIVFTATFAGGISPYFFRWNEVFVSLGTQFAGGVFLGTALMHFLRDSAKTFTDLTDNEYPLAFMLSTAGYLLTMLGDLVVTWVNAKQEKRKEIIPEANTKKTSLDSSASVRDSLLLILALCFHSFFEGIAIGVAETKAEAWKTLWTVSLHKIFAAIAMGVALLQIIPNRPLLSTATYAFAFAISTPIGVVVGILIDATTEGRLADWFYAISMGLACGIFIYVAINHLLKRGTTHHNSQDNEIPLDKPFYSFMAVVLGSGLISVVMIWD